MVAPAGRRWLGRRHGAEGPVAVGGTAKPETRRAFPAAAGPEILGDVRRSWPAETQRLTTPESLVFRGCGDNAGGAWRAGCLSLRPPRWSGGWRNRAQAHLLGFVGPPHGNCCPKERGDSLSRTGNSCDGRARLIRRRADRPPLSRTLRVVERIYELTRPEIDGHGPISLVGTEAHIVAAELVNGWRVPRPINARLVSFRPSPDGVAHLIA